MVKLPRSAEIYESSSGVNASTAKDSRIDLRVTKKQKEILEKASLLKGISLSAYTLAHLLPIAQQEIEEQEKLILSNRDRDLFLAALENPPVLKGNLKSAIANYRDKYGS